MLFHFQATIWLPAVNGICATMLIFVQLTRRRGMPAAYNEALPAVTRQRQVRCQFAAVRILLSEIELRQVGFHAVGNIGNVEPYRNDIDTQSVQHIGRLWID